MPEVSRLNCEADNFKSSTHLSNHLIQALVTIDCQDDDTNDQTRCVRRRCMLLKLHHSGCSDLLCAQKRSTVLGNPVHTYLHLQLQLHQVFPFAAVSSLPMQMYMPQEECLSA